MIEVDKGLFRGPKCDIAPLKAAGFRSVLNLETETRELLGFGDPNLEFKQCQNSNVILFDMAFSGIFPPKWDDVNSALGVLRWGARPLYFHCRAGRERTGFLAACYRMHVQGWSYDDAFAEWVRLGCRFPTWLLWQSALKKWDG